MKTEIEINSINDAGYEMGFDIYNTPNQELSVATVIDNKKYCILVYRWKYYIKTCLYKNVNLFNDQIDLMSNDNDYTLLYRSDKG